MSEDQEQNGFRTIRVKTNVTSPVALVLVMLVEFIMFAFYPFVFLVIIPANDYIEYPAFVYKYQDGEKKVVLTKNVRFSNYADWDAKEQYDGDGSLRVLKGSVIEVAQVDMKDYPERAPYISIAFYYDEEGHGYTLWGGIEMDWIDKPDEILSDLDDLRAAEAKNNRDVITKVILGLLGTFAFAAFDVFLVYLVFKKNLERHVYFASALVIIVFALLFVLGPIGSKIYYSKIKY